MGVFALLFLLTVGVRAQNVSSQDVMQKKKEINQVKLGEDAIYAEVIDMVTGDDEAISLAQQRSIDKLQISVIEACAAKMNLSKENVKEIFDVIDDKCQNITIDAGDIIRVFTYISKDAIGLTRRKPKEKDVEEIFGSDYLNNSLSSVQSKKEEIVKSKSELEVKSETTSVVKQDDNSIVVSEPVISSVPKVEPKPVSVSTSEPVAKVNSVSEVVVPNLCKTMISKGKMNELMLYLKQEKKYQRLMFGNRNSMQFLEKCYIVIIDKGTQNIVTVLDKGESARMNFVSKQMDSLANYRGGNYAAIYVQEY